MDLSDIDPLLADYRFFFKPENVHTLTAAGQIAVASQSRMLAFVQTGAGGKFSIWRLRSPALSPAGFTTWPCTTDPAIRPSIWPSRIAEQTDRDPDVRTALLRLRGPFETASVQGSYLCVADDEFTVLKMLFAGG